MGLSFRLGIRSGQQTQCCGMSAHVPEARTSIHRSVATPETTLAAPIAIIDLISPEYLAIFEGMLVNVITSLSKLLAMPSKLSSKQCNAYHEAYIGAIAMQI